MTDLFEEVEEQLRSDRYQALARKALPWVIGIVAVAVIGVLAFWGFDTWRTKTIAKASEQYQAATEAAGAGDLAKARQLWTEVSDARVGGYKALALMQLAGIALQENRTDAAVKLLDEAAKAAPDNLLGDLARLKSAFALLDTAAYRDLEARLTPLMEDGRPYRLQAREALAFAKLMAGNTAGARTDFLVLSRALDGAEGLRSRADAAVGLIDAGSAKQVPTVVKAAAAAALRPAPNSIPAAPSAPAAPQSPANGPQ